MSFREILLESNIKLAVIGDIHEALPQFKKIVHEINPDSKQLLISVGDIFDKGAGIEAAKEIIRDIRDLHEQGLAYIVQGNHDAKHWNKVKKHPELQYEEIVWLSKQPRCISFVYPNRNRFTVLHAGVTPKHTWNDLGSPDVMYVRKVDENGDYIPLRWITLDDGKKELVYKKEGGKFWAEEYDGRFGYLITGHDANEDGPKYYPYSVNVDTSVFSTGVLTAQIIDASGLVGVIRVSD